MNDAQTIIDILDLAPHPEGGYYRETFRDEAQIDGRAASTAIYYLLMKGQRSHWHRVDATEMWHWYAGAPLELSIKQADKTLSYQLGCDFSAGQRPQHIIPKDVWQSAETLGEWTLAGCTVAPGFQFEGFELAPEDFE